jgi:hypothetical protein
VDAETTGGFGGSTWFQTGSLLAPQNIADLAGRVQRYDKPLGQNNPPCRDFTVMWGKVCQPKSPTLPPDPYDYCSFQKKDIIDQPTWNGDGDFAFDFVILWDTQYPNGTDIGFWNYGWLTEQVKGLPPVTLIARLYEQWELFHCEAAMYGRENSGYPDCAFEPRCLLPGWNEYSGWSVLVNGRPIQGWLVVLNANDPNLVLYFPVLPGGQTVDLQSGTIARVTGVVAYDDGHPQGCRPPEIHPVYAIDVQQDFTRRYQPATLSGVWHGSDNATYYIRQLDRNVWWLGLSRDQGRSFANVFHGTIGESGPLVGEWVDVPMGVGGVLSGGTLTLQGDQLDTQLSTTLTKTAETADFGAGIWTKIYDTEGVPVSPLPVIESAE